MKASAERQVVITRTFDAPRERMWKAWTEREQLMQWFGPRGFTMSTAKLMKRLVYGGFSTMVKGW
jgi:uncharacterized protein YndB with AHSA1/START domain